MPTAAWLVNSQPRGSSTLSLCYADAARILKVHWEDGILKGVA